MMWSIVPVKVVAKTIEKNKVVNLPEETSTTKVIAVTTNETVKGEATSTPTIVSSLKSNILSIFKSPTLFIVKNTDNVKEVAPEKEVISVEKYSTWYGRLLFGGSGYVQTIYQIMILIIAFALIVMIFIEIRKQHPKHIIYGVLMLAILIVFVLINKSLIY
ncbi:MAG: hypothetical protein NTW35_02970 [Candidatus Nomurabacteria bacterium]|nr:hypothetical protein [Candidatus Nomurabacteria bacterium]